MCSVDMCMASQLLIIKHEIPWMQHWDQVIHQTLPLPKGRETLIVHGHTQRLRTRETVKVASNLLHIFSGCGANVIHTVH